MSFKDLTTRAAAAMKPKPAETKAPADKEAETKATDTHASETPETS